MVELAGYIASKGVVSTIGFNLGGTVQLPGVAVTLVEAKHSSSVEDGGKTLYLGVAAGLVLTIQDGPVLYHAGDTSVFRDMELIAELYAPEVAMLPIGDHYTMGPKEAALAIRYLKPQVALPIHWGTFPALTGTPQELKKLVSDPEIVAMVAPGEALQA
jgi:L-ascorbate metabolism protein UlaG (beta-lactamase superfamily)